MLSWRNNCANCALKGRNLLTKPTHAARSRHAHSHSPPQHPSRRQRRFVTISSGKHISNSSISVRSYHCVDILQMQLPRCGSSWPMKDSRTPRGTNQPSRGFECTRLPGGCRQRNFQLGQNVGDSVSLEQKCDKLVLEKWILIFSLCAIRDDLSLRRFRAIPLPCGWLLASPSTEGCTAHFN